MSGETNRRKQVVTTEASPLPGGAYSQAIVANGFVFTSGALPTRTTVGSQLGGFLVEIDVVAVVQPDVAGT